MNIEPLPGAKPFDAALRARLDDAWSARDRSEKPRTRHLRPDSTGARLPGRDALDRARAMLGEHYDSLHGGTRRAPNGTFYAASDADSPDGRREEGLYFTWTPGEVDAALSRDEARLVREHFGVTAAGNFGGRSVLHLARPLGEAARSLGLP